MKTKQRGTNYQHVKGQPNWQTEGKIYKTIKDSGKNCRFTKASGKYYQTKGWKWPKYQRKGSKQPSYQINKGQKLPVWQRGLKQQQKAHWWIDDEAELLPELRWNYCHSNTKSSTKFFSNFRFCLRYPKVFKVKWNDKKKWSPNMFVTHTDHMQRTRTGSCWDIFLSTLKQC